MVMTADRDTHEREGKEFSYPMAATTHLYAGQLIVLNALGNAEAATAAASKLCVGRAAEEVNNTGGIAAKYIKVKAGVFKWANSGAMTKTSIGSTVYIHDDQTVKANGVGTSPAGIMVDIEADGVWVATGSEFIKASSGLLAANNLNDVANAATSRASLGLDTGNSPTFVGLTLTGNLGCVDATASGAIKGATLQSTGQTTADNLVVTKGATFGTTVAAKGAVTGTRVIATKVVDFSPTDPAIDGASVVQCATDGKTLILPLIAAGNKGMKITLQNTGAATACEVDIAIDANNYIKGTVAAVNSGEVKGKGWINTKATSTKGAYTTVVSDGTDTWWIIGGVGVWASEA